MSVIIQSGILLVCISVLIALLELFIAQAERISIYRIQNGDFLFAAIITTSLWQSEQTVAKGLSLNALNRFKEY